MSYLGETCAQMAARVAVEVGHVKRLQRASRMWLKAREELDLSAAALDREVADLAAQWTDHAGGLFAARGSAASKGMAQWVARIDAAQPWVALDVLAGDIPVTKTYLDQCAEAEKLLLAMAAVPGAGQAAQAQLVALRQQAAARMEALDKLFAEAASAVTAAAGGERAMTSAAGGPGGPGGPGGGPSGGPAGGPAGGAGGPAGGAAGGPAGGPAGAGGPAAGGAPGGAAGGGPALSGGTATPPKLPSVPPVADLPQPRPIPPLPQLPVVPPVATPGVASALSARGVGGRGVGGRGVGGAALTGLPVVPAIPQAAKPGALSAAALTPPPPLLPTAAGASSAPTTGGGAVPPMVPPTSGAARSGAGNPKPGNAQRQPAGKGRPRAGTPGVPEALRGRATATGALPTRADRRRPCEPDALDALDEELWQTEEPRTPLTSR